MAHQPFFPRLPLGNLSSCPQGRQSSAAPEKMSSKASCLGSALFWDGYCGHGVGDQEIWFCYGLNRTEGQLVPTRP